MVTDYRPVIATAGLGEVIGFPLFGVEVSPYAGHMGAYGVRYEPDHPEGAGGSPPLITQEDGAWRKRRIPELVAAARERGAEVLQINHPRDSSGLFDSVRYDSQRGVVLPFGALISLFLPDFGIHDVPIVVQETWYVQGVAARYTGKRAALPAD